MFNWITNLWAKFEAWVASWMPGLKTRITLALSSVGTLAALVYAYLTQLPINDVINAKYIAWALLATNTLSYWFSNLTARVEDRK